MTECQHRGRPPGFHRHLLLLLLPHLLDAADSPELSPSLLLPHIQLDEGWKRFLLPPYAPPKERGSSLVLEPTERRRFEVVPSPVSSSNPWVPIIPTIKQAHPSPPTRAPHPHFDVSLHSGSSSSKEHLPRGRHAGHQEAPKRQQYQDRPPKSHPRKRPPQRWRAQKKAPVPRRHIKLVLERQKPLINLVPKIKQVPKFNLVPKIKQWPKRRETAKLPPPTRPKATASKSLRPPPLQPKRHAWGELHSRHHTPAPLTHPPRAPQARRKQGRRTFELGGLLGNLFPKRIRGEARSSKILVKPYLGKSLPRPMGRPPRGRDRRQRRVNKLPTGALAQAISLGVVAAVLAV